MRFVKRQRQALRLATAPSPAGLDALQRIGPVRRLDLVQLFCARLGLIWSRVDLSDRGTPICRERRKTSQHSEYRHFSLGFYPCRRDVGPPPCRAIRRAAGV
jgi:hypothetical protein